MRELSSRAQPPLLTPEQTLERRGIGELEFSPDGARLVFTVTEPVEGRGAAAQHLDARRRERQRPPADVLRRRATRRRAGRPTADRSRSSPIATAPRSSTSCRWAAARPRSSPIARSRIECVPLVARRQADRAADGRAEAGGAAEARERQGRCARRGERGPPGARLDARRRVARAEAADVGAVPHRADRVRARRRPPDRGGVAEAARGSVQRGDLRRRPAATARFTPIAAPRGPMGAIALSPDGDDDRLRLRARRRSRTRTTSACSRSPAARRATSPARRSIARSASRSGSTTRRSPSASRAGSRRRIDDRRHATAARSASTALVGQPVGVRARDGRHDRLRRRDARRGRRSSGSRRRTRPRAPSPRSTSGGRRAGRRAGVREVQERRRHRDRSGAPEAISHSAISHCPGRHPRPRRPDRALERHLRGVGTAARRARLRRALSERARLDRLRPALRRDEPRRLGRRRLQGRDGRRRLAGRARHRRSRIASASAAGPTAATWPRGR